MKIAVHAQVLTAPNLFGIGYYLYNLLQALAAARSENTFYLFSGAPLSFAPRCRALCPMIKPRHLPSRCFSYFAFPAMASKMQCDIAFLPKEVAPFCLPMPIVMTAYDLYALKMPQEIRHEFPRSSFVHYRLAKLLHFRRANKILAISEDTKQDLIELCGIPDDRIAVTPLAADPIFSLPIPEEKKKESLRKWGIASAFFLNTSSYWWGRKNLVRLIQAFSRAKKRTHLPHQLVITGKPGPSLEAMRQTILQEGISNDVKLVSYLEREELAALMQSAEALIFPSLHEGFGMPILEAMAAGCPVVTSNISAMPEAAGDAGVLVDPLDVESIAQGIEQVVCDRDLRKQMVAKGFERARTFTWEQTAQKTWDAMQL
jgi:alpha-1,3-rhamnosyl/mannosyltransferase